MAQGKCVWCCLRCLLRKPFSPVIEKQGQSKEVSRADEFTLGQAKGNGEY
jgi:hypothetical protein